MNSGQLREPTLGGVQNHPQAHTKMSFPGVVRSNGTGGHISSVVVLWSSWVASASRWLTGPRSFFTIVVEAKTIRCRLTLLMLGKTTKS